MSEGKVERKVAVILATDVVGYSTRIEQNETQTLQTLKACREIIQELIGEHQGRVFNTAGDSVLAEFSSAVEAVLCASEFQRTIKERNDSVDTEAERMEFRIGVNMGDVVIEGDNLYGEGINVAARLEALAQSGGICLSKNVYDIVYNKMSLSFTDLGEQQVKDTVLHAVDVSLDGTGQRKLPGTKKAQSSTRMAYLVAGLAIITLMVGGGVWWQQQRGAGVNETEVRTQVVRDNLPIILVKPFKSLGGEDASVSNAITESLISSLSRYKMLSVLSSSTSFHILETKMPDSEIAQRFRVKHVIQGSVQSFGKNTRLTLELNDLSKGKVVWSDQVDFLLDDIFKVQDEIGNKILGQLQITAVEGQEEEQWLSQFETFEQYLLFLNYESEWSKWTKDGYDKTQEILKKLRALNTDENVTDYVEAWILHQALLMRFSQNEKEQDLERLDNLTKSVIENRGNERDYAGRALMELEHLSKDCKVAKSYIPESIENSNSRHNLVTVGYIYKSCGDLGTAIPYFREALRYAPVDKGYMVSSQLVSSLYVLGRTKEIEAFIGEKIDNVDMHGMILWIYASIELENGNAEKAKELFKRGRDYGTRRKWVFYN
ncbi:MAG: hypothetical protein HN610_15415, partial [Verrucomicrobia bacterium]|nr:hypothetical protein [Verrucomicrobiota bacterium]